MSTTTRMTITPTNTATGTQLPAGTGREIPLRAGCGTGSHT